MRMEGASGSVALAEDLLIRVVVGLQAHPEGGVGPADRLHSYGKVRCDAAAAADELLERDWIEAEAHGGGTGRLVPEAAVADNVAGMSGIVGEAHGRLLVVVKQIGVADLAVDEVVRGDHRFKVCDSLHLLGLIGLRSAHRRAREAGSGQNLETQGLCPRALAERRTCGDADTGGLVSADSPLPDTGTASTTRTGLHRAS